MISAGLAESLPTWRAAFSDRTCALMAAFCQLAYIPFDDPAAAESNRTLLKARLAGGGFDLVEIFNHESIQAFLAIHPQQFAVLAFRGTAGLPNWVTDLTIKPVPLPGRPGILVHKGFRDAFEGCREEIFRSVRANVPDDLGLYITGHSLGGGLAQLAAAILDADNIAACYTFGSPRVGTSEFDRQVKCPHYRLVNRQDIVPSVPPPWFAGFTHTGDPRLLKARERATPAFEELRRERDGLATFWFDARSLAYAIFTKAVPMIDDHMIWNYRTQLETLADVRTGKTLRPPGTARTPR